MKPRGDIFEHPRIGLTAVALLLCCAGAKKDRVNATALTKYQLHHLVVDRIERRHIEEPASYTRLVRGDDNAITILVEPGDCLNRTVDRFPLTGRLDELITIVIDYAIAVENYQFRLGCHGSDST